MHLYANILVRPKITEIYHILHTFPITKPKLDRNSKKGLLQFSRIVSRILKMFSFLFILKNCGRSIDFSQLKRYFSGEAKNRKKSDFFAICKTHGCNYYVLCFPSLHVAMLLWNMNQLDKNKSFTCIIVL